MIEVQIYKFFCVYLRVISNFLIIILRMRLKKVIKLIKEHRFGMRAKLNLSFGAISVVLLISSIISILEYSRMSRYMSELISKDVKCISVARGLADVSNEYNLDILALIGDGSLTSMPDFDASSFTSRCDSLRDAIAYNSFLPLADSVEYSYAAYMLTSMELKSVVESDFINTREWYFDRLQPKYDRLRSDIDSLSSSLYGELNRHTMDFDSGFYRSIIPSSVSVAVSLLLVILLLFFINSYYIAPLLQIHKGLSSYRSYNKNYTVNFEGDDELRDINEGIKELCDENQKLASRIVSIRKSKS